MSKFNIDYASKFKLCMAISTVFVLGFAGMFFFGKGLNYGVDFRGGAEIMVEFKKPITEAELRGYL
jgi:SecD/SecF fusion protein